MTRVETAEDAKTAGGKRQTPVQSCEQRATASLLQRQPMHRVGGYAEFAPAGKTRPWLESYWIHLHGSGATSKATHHVVPDPGISLAYTCRRSSGAVECPALIVMGPVETPRTFASRSGFEMVCLRIKMEYAGAVLRVSPQEHRDAKDDYLGIRPRAAEPLLERLAALGSATEVLAALSDEVQRWVRSSRTEPRLLAARTLEVLRRTAGRARIDRLAGHLELSPRSLHRLVSDAIGMPPKLYARLLRFHRVLTTADRLSRPDWAGLAVEAGYYDQSHMIRDFLEFARATPRKLHLERRAESEISNPS